MVFVLASQTLKEASVHHARPGFMSILTATVRIMIMVNAKIANCNFTPFLACECSSSGASSSACTSSGVCTCKSNFEGSKCTSCKAGFYDYPNCYCMN